MCTSMTSILSSSADHNIIEPILILIIGLGFSVPKIWRNEAFSSVKTFRTFLVLGEYKIISTGLYTWNRMWGLYYKPNEDIYIDAIYVEAEAENAFNKGFI